MGEKPDSNKEDQPHPLGQELAVQDRDKLDATLEQLRCLIDERERLVQALGGAPAETIRRAINEIDLWEDSRPPSEWELAQDPSTLTTADWQDFLGTNQQEVAFLWFQLNAVEAQLLTLSKPVAKSTESIYKSFQAVKATALVGPVRAVLQQISDNNYKLDGLDDSLERLAATCGLEIPELRRRLEDDDVMNCLIGISPTGGLSSMSKKRGPSDAAKRFVAQLFNNAGETTVGNWSKAAREMYPFLDLKINE